MALKENFLNDIFEGNRKYQITKNEDGTYTILDVTEYTQEGDLFGAGDINATNAAVNAHISAKNNPHCVTAEEVGARPNTWMPSAEQVGAVPISLKGQAVYCDDLFAAYENATFVQWDGNTANTPFKAGLAYGSEGFAFVHGNWSVGWHTVVAWQKGGIESNMWMHTVDGGYDLGWHDMTAFLPLTGGTLNGVLGILGDGYHQVRSANGQWFGIDVTENDGSGNTRRFYLVNNAHSPLSNAVHIYDNSSRYILFGEHNITAGTTEPTSLANGCIYEMYE